MLQCLCAISSPSQVNIKKNVEHYQLDQAGSWGLLDIYFSSWSLETDPWVRWNGIKYTKKECVCVCVCVCVFNVSHHFITFWNDTNKHKIEHFVRMRGYRVYLQIYFAILINLQALLLQPINQMTSSAFEKYLPPLGLYFMFSLRWTKQRTINREQTEFVCMWTHLFKSSVMRLCLIIRCIFVRRYCFQWHKSTFIY